MKLLQLYSLGSGLKINEPFIYKAFFPLPFEKYITVHSSAGMPSKEYTFWEDVIELIKPRLDELGIKIVQIGGPKDEPIKHTFDLKGKTTINQTAYILSNSLLHLSNDSFSAHVSGFLGVPLVVLYGSTTVKNHSPYFYDEGKTTFIEADLKGKKPSYAREEAPKMVDTIKPEDIANAALKVFDSSVSHETLRIGEYYPTYIVEYVPDHILPQQTLSGGVINIRMDYAFNEDYLIRALYNRKCNVVSNKPVDIKIIKSFKKHINRFALEVTDETEVEYARQLKSTGIDVHFFSKEEDEEKLRDLRLRFFEFEIELEPPMTKEKLDISDKIGENTFYKTNKFILAKDGMYLSNVDRLAGNKIKDLSDNIKPIKDTPDFWEEVDYFYIFNRP